MRCKSFLMAAVGAALLATPAIASAQNNQQSEPGAEKPTPLRPNRLLLGSGALALGVPYISSVLVAASTDDSANNNLYIPVVGPWITLGQRTCTDADPCEAEFLTGALLVGDGIMQGAGLLAIGASFLVPESATTVPLGASAKMTIAPTKVGRTGYGIGAVGQF